MRCLQKLSLKPLWQVQMMLKNLTKNWWKVHYRCLYLLGVQFSRGDHNKDEKLTFEEFFNTDKFILEQFRNHFKKADANGIIFVAFFGLMKVNWSFFCSRFVYWWKGVSHLHNKALSMIIVSVWWSFVLFEHHCIIIISGKPDQWFCLVSVL